MISAGNTPYESSEEDSHDDFAKEINDIGAIPVVSAKPKHPGRVGRPRHSEMRKMANYQRKLVELKALLNSKTLDKKHRRSA